MRNEFELDGDILRIFIHSPKLGSLIVLADASDFELLAPHRWYADKTRTLTYIKSSTGGRLSRLIMNCPKGMLVDHCNRNTLDNRRTNLRVCTNAENTANRIGKRTSFRGIHVETRGKVLKYRAQLKTNKKVHFSKVFLTEIEAAKAYNDLALKFFGEYALLNQL